MATLKKTLRLVTVLAVMTLIAFPAFAQDYDLVIQNGRVMDPETMFDGVRNVGIKDGKIYKNTLK